MDIGCVRMEVEIGAGCRYILCICGGGGWVYVEVEAGCMRRLGVYGGGVGGWV